MMKRTHAALGLLSIASWIVGCSAPTSLRSERGPGDAGTSSEDAAPSDSDHEADAEDDDDLEFGVYELSSTSGPIRTITANRDTFLKATTGQSSSLPDSQRCAIPAGTRLSLSTPATPAEAAHYQVRLSAPIGGCALTEGFVFGDHFDAVTTITATSSTWLKASIADSSTLPASQRCLVASGSSLVITRSPRDAGSGHFAVDVEPPAGCAIRSGFVFGAHFGLRAAEPAPAPAPAPSGRRIESVPYRYQYDNANEPSATCGLTSASMMLGFHGITVTPDELYRRFGKAQGQSPGNLASLYRSYGLHATSTYGGTFADVRRHIDAGRPVVVHGDFTPPGHVVMIVGYDDRGFVFHDPSGRWNGVYRGGYPGRTRTNGRFVHYSYGSLENVIGPSGNVWMSVASRGPL